MTGPEKAKLWRAVRPHLRESELARVTGSSTDDVIVLLDQITSLVEREWNLKRGVLYFDGAARRNPGPAGIGVVLLDDSGRKLAEISNYIGETTSNVAEYRALIAGLNKAKESGLTSIQILTDSELLTKQINGEYRVKHRDLIPLWREANKLLRGFSHWEMKQLPRSENRDADRLASQAIDIHVAGLDEE